MKRRIYLSPPDVGELERGFLLDAFDSNWIAPLGPHVETFEQEFCAAVGVPHAVALSSGTAALHLVVRQPCQRRDRHHRQHAQGGGSEPQPGNCRALCRPGNQLPAREPNSRVGAARPSLEMEGRNGEC